MKICPRCHLRYENQDSICQQDGVRLEAIQEDKKQMFDALIGTILEGRYKIISKIGQGGMGAVYKAEQVRMNRICAIKVIPEEMAQNGDAIERFNREAQMSALINDPHAVTVYDFGETNNGMYFLAMEYVEGETLASLIKRERIIQLNRTFDIVRQAGQALACAHNQNIVHRDLKPDNIMLAKKDGNDWVKVLDFGIAKRAIDDKSNDLTQTGMVIGTPLYMSPEQLAGEKLDPRSDIYSFSIIAYQLLTGKLPFSGENAQSIMVKRITENPIPPTVANPQVMIPPGVEAAIMNALVRNRNMRTPTIQKFVEQFDQGIKDFNNYRGKTSPNVTIPTSPQPQIPFVPTPGVIPPTQNIPSGPQSVPGSQPGFTPPNLGGFPPNQNPTAYPIPPGQMPFPSQPISGMPTNPKPFNNPTIPTPPPYPPPNNPKPGQVPISGQIPSYPNANTGPSIQPPKTQQPQFPPTQSMPQPNAGFPYQQQNVAQPLNSPYSPQPMQPVQPPFPPQPQILPKEKKKSYKTFWIFAAIFIFVVLAGSCSVCVLVLNAENSPNSTPVEDPINRTAETTSNDLNNNSTDKWSNNSSDTKDDYYEKGVNYLDEENYELAIKEFKLAIELDPNFLEAQENLAVALYNIKQYDNALEAFIRANQLDSSNPLTLAFMGFSYQLTNKIDLANEAYDNFLENYADDPYTSFIKRVKSGNSLPPEKISYDDGD
ncbi:MAG: protein kinase [Acidobacteria bacterium]|nr:protein kinase [Acidobacteriota bacterium]